MKKLFVMLIALFLLPGISLAGKPVKSDPVDYEALIETERLERIAADDGLHSQIDNIELIEGPAGSQGEQGQAGVNGTNGTNGIDGSDGINGISCWDLADDDICDASDDVNGDGLCDALDCQPASSSTAAVMYLKRGVQGCSGGPCTVPSLCPVGWTEADLTRVDTAYQEYMVRTCFNMDNSCTVMEFERTNPGGTVPMPPLCPADWIEAGLNIRDNSSRWVRTCFYCSQ